MQWFVYFIGFDLINPLPSPSCQKVCCHWSVDGETGRSQQSQDSGGRIMDGAWGTYPVWNDRLYIVSGMFFTHFKALVVYSPEGFSWLDSTLSENLKKSMWRAFIGYRDNIRGSFQFAQGTTRWTVIRTKNPAKTALRRKNLNDVESQTCHIFIRQRDEQKKVQDS